MATRAPLLGLLLLGWAFCILVSGQGPWASCRGRGDLWVSRAW